MYATVCDESPQHRQIKQIAAMTGKVCSCLQHCTYTFWSMSLGSVESQQTNNVMKTIGNVPMIIRLDCTFCLTTSTDVQNILANSCTVHMFV